MAARCSEWPLPFNQSASPLVRREQARHALFALPEDAFGLFSREAILPAWPIPECYEWPASPRSVFRVEGKRAALGRTPALLDLAGAVSVPAEKRGVAWNEVRRRTRTSRAQAAR